METNYKQIASGLIEGMALRLDEASTEHGVYSGNKAVTPEEMLLSLNNEGLSQYFNCRHCLNVLSFMSTLAVPNHDGLVSVWDDELLWSEFGSVFGNLFDLFTENVKKFKTVDLLTLDYCKANFKKLKWVDPCGDGTAVAVEGLKDETFPHFGLTIEAIEGVTLAQAEPTLKNVLALIGKIRKRNDPEYTERVMRITRMVTAPARLTVDDVTIRLIQKILARGKGKLSMKEVYVEFNEMYFCGVVSDLEHIPVLDILNGVFQEGLPLWKAIENAVGKGMVDTELSRNAIESSRSECYTALREKLDIPERVVYYAACSSDMEDLLWEYPEHYDNETVDSVETIIEKSFPRRLERFIDDFVAKGMKRLDFIGYRSGPGLRKAYQHFTILKADDERAANAMMWAGDSTVPNPTTYMTGDPDAGVTIDKPLAVNGLLPMPWVALKKNGLDFTYHYLIVDSVEVPFMGLPAHVKVLLNHEIADYQDEFLKSQSVDTNYTFRLGIAITAGMVLRVIDLDDEVHYVTIVDVE